MNSLIVTLGVSAVLPGIVTGTRAASRSSPASRPTLIDLGSGDWFGIPRTVYYLAVVAAFVYYLLEHTPFGRYLQSIGSNRDAARLVGLPVERLVLLSFVLSGTLAGLAGVLLVARNGGASPQVGTVADTLQALAAAYLGATAIKPGRFNVVGTLVAIFFLAFTVTGLSLAGVANWINDVFNGAALFVAVLISTIIGPAPRGCPRRRRQGQQRSRPIEIRELGARGHAAQHLAQRVERVASARGPVLAGQARQVDRRPQLEHQRALVRRHLLRGDELGAGRRRRGRIEQEQDRGTDPVRLGAEEVVVRDVRPAPSASSTSASASCSSPMLTRMHRPLGHDERQERLRAQRLPQSHCLLELVERGAGLAGVPETDGACPTTRRRPRTTCRSARPALWCARATRGPVSKRSARIATMPRTTRRTPR